jgi:hypothetical protein
VALACGAGTVSAVANLLEWCAPSPPPPYHPHGQRFDQSHFRGRYCSMLLSCDPKLLLYRHQQVLELQQMLQQQQHNTTGQTTQKQRDDRSLWEAHRVVQAALHPDTNEWIPRPFRVAGFIPCNTPISVLMIAAPTTTHLLFWAWVNQSHNAMLNYYNRNASSSSSPNDDDNNDTTVWKSYVGAVGAALTVAFGLATLSFNDDIHRLKHNDY